MIVDNAIFKIPLLNDVEFNVILIWVQRLFFLFVAFLRLLNSWIFLFIFSLSITTRFWLHNGTTLLKSLIFLILLGWSILLFFYFNLSFIWELLRLSIVFFFTIDVIFRILNLVLLNRFFNSSILRCSYFIWSWRWNCSWDVSVIILTSLLRIISHLFKFHWSRWILNLLLILLLFGILNSFSVTFILSFIKKSLFLFDDIWVFFLSCLNFLFWNSNFFFTWFFFIFLLVSNFLKSRGARFYQFYIFLKFIFDTSHMMLNFILVFHKSFLLCFNFMIILFFISGKVLAMKLSINSNLPSDIFNLVKLRNISDDCFDYEKGKERLWKRVENSYWLAINWNLDVIDV